MAVQLRPEVAMFAAAMQRLLDSHQAEKGDAWKGDDAVDLLASIQRASGRLFDVVFETPTRTARTLRVGEAAASVALHAMFVADVTGALVEGDQVEEADGAPPSTKHRKPLFETAEVDRFAFAIYAGVHRITEKEAERELRMREPQAQGRIARAARMAIAVAHDVRHAGSA